MKIIWDWSLQTETERILDTTRQIGNGFFGLQHFYPLSWDHQTKYLSFGVYLPQLDYPSIPHFWSQVVRLDDNHFPLLAPPALLTQTHALLLPIDLTPPSTSSLENLTQTVVPRVLKFFHQFSPSTPLPTKIIIHPTYFGTYGSFNLMKSDKKVILIIRLDQGIKTLVECLLSSLLSQSAMNDLSSSWSETEFLVDWLISSSALSQILPSDPTWSGTLSTTRHSVSIALQAQSAHFLTQIGAPIPTFQTFSLKNNQVYYHNNPLPGLTARESRLMTKLIEISPAPLTLDEIADLIFIQEDKFSLAAITKTIERLRTKLNSLGISRHYLATASGIGYYLKN
ncbi:hypothetical protein COT87_00825 [Candidatus Collierbacteria bacterium CG10_big_fil_rev_8_21_14_0_10_44_9]|uniref:OmpR/PhoB-type domain-containing protein n=1 Tax=Candidatus Collierbacteria bacterium CG10_big_fil_rev_8_21_14_0_10_44_9 TaxID=1974535 RepID=A0A2H0VJB0_9BACT|nr:MAG: hypothetical protein COT87_00825 [Candidatus Collierbacteria bacterium CG10_big_fil_rev_8_21_14_0_10_44_9]